MSGNRVWRYVENTRFLLSISAVLFFVLVLGFVYLTPAVPPREHPEKPDDLTTNNVNEYVSAYERAEIYRARDPSKNEDFHVDCTSAVDRVTEDGYYVVTSCNGGFSGPGGRSGHFGTGHRFYVVNDTATVRVRPEYDRLADSSVQGLGTFYAVNFDTHEHPLRVRIVNMTTGEEVFRQNYTLQNRSGIYSDRAPAGEYILVVTSEQGETVRYEWSVTSKYAVQLSIQITPTGELVIRQVPESA